MKKLFVVFIIIIFSAYGIFAQNPQKPDDSVLSWRYMLEAQIDYEYGRYGNAVKNADIAKQKRKNEIDWVLFAMNQALKSPEVQKAGDNIEEITKLLKKRNSENALIILDSFYSKYSKEYFSNSMSKFLETARKYYAYPEADYMLGNLYILEGEYVQAEKYLDAAWENCEILDIPNQKYEILYKMSYLANLQKDYDKYEKTLQLIIADDGYITTTGADGSLLRAVKQSMERKEMTIDKLFMLYRSHSYDSLDAYYKLADFYLARNEKEKAVKMATIANLTAFTRLYDAVKERDMDYKYTDFLSYLEKIGKYYDISEWGSKNGIWKGYFKYSQLLIECGKEEMGKELLSALSQYCPEDYWRSMAFRELLSKI